MSQPDPAGTNDAPALLPPLSSAYPPTREALHRVAEAIVSPARVAATGNEIALESLRAASERRSSLAVAGSAWSSTSWSSRRPTASCAAHG